MPEERGVGVPTAASGLRLRGREQLIRAVGAALAAGGAGAPRVVSLVGEPGIGKTTVLAAVRRSAADRWSWSTRCLESEADLGLAVLGDLFTWSPTDVVETLPGPQRRAVELVLYRDEPSEPVGPRLLGATTLSLLRAVARTGAVLLIVDDRQWCDPTSLQALQFALHRLAGDEPVKVLTGQRPDGGQSFDGAQFVSLEPLNPVDTTALVRDVLSPQHRDTGSDDLDDVVAAVADRSGGNPLFAIELARHLVHDGDGSGLPQSLRAALYLRLDRLPRSTSPALLDVAVRGVPPLSEVDVDAIEPALRAGLLRITDGCVTFAHPLLAEAILDRATPTEIREAHRRAARSTSDPVAAALHRSKYEEGGADLARELDAAVEIALNRGDRSGARNLARLAFDAEPTASDRVRRLRRLVELDAAVGNWSGLGGMAQRLYADAEDADTKADALYFQSLATGDDQAALLLLQRAVSVAGLSDRTRDNIICALACCQFSLGSTDDAIRTVDEALDGLDDPAQRLPAVVATAAWLHRLTGRRTNHSLLDRAVERQRNAPLPSDGRPAVAAWVLAQAGEIAVFDDQHERAAELLLDANSAAAHVGDWDQGEAGLFRLALRQGRLREARQHLEHAYSDFADIPSVASIVAANSCLLWTWLGDYARADSRVPGDADLDDSAFDPDLKFAVGFRRLLAGDADAAWPPLRSAAQDLERWGYREPSWPPVLPAAVEAAVAVGALVDARRLAARLERDSAALDSRWGRAAASRCRGCVAQATNDAGQAMDHFADAAARFSEIGARLEAARSWHLLGALERRLGRRRLARQHLQAAREIYAEAGASALLRDAEIELARIGGRVAHDPNQLTESERQVAEQAVLGLRNAEIAQHLHLSVKTVETHLSRAYRKLGVTNRAGLGAALPADPGRD